MKMFVTGATGFIGKRLVERLIRDGHRVTALTRNKEHGLPSEVSAVIGDILEPNGWKDAGKGCDRLYHLAAMVSFDPAKLPELLRVNGTGTTNVLEASDDWCLSSTVVVSSACTIGLSYSKDELLDERSVPDRNLIESNPYLKSKLACEVAAVSYSESRKVVIVNPTTVYGPGDDSLNSGTLIKKISASAILPVPPGGSNVIDVDDAVEGMILAGDKGRAGKRYILGAQNLTYREIFTVISNMLVKRHVMVPMPGFMRMPLSLAAGIFGAVSGSRLVTRQIVDDMFSYKFFSTRLACDELGFKPGYGFAESVNRAIAYYREKGLLKI